MSSLDWFNLVLGIGGSFVASALFLSALLFLRPVLRISELISKTTLEGHTLYCIKVVNASWRDAIGLRAELALVQPDRVPGGIASRHRPLVLRKDSLFVLRRWNTFEPHPTFAFRFITTDDLPGLWQAQESLCTEH